MTDFDADVSSSGLVPTSDDYVGCYNDLVADRVLTTVTTDDALTPAVSMGSIRPFFFGGVRFVCVNQFFSTTAPLGLGTCLYRVNSICFLEQHPANRYTLVTHS